MSSEAALKTVVAFDKLPATPEKDEIKRQYLADEIGAFEFFSMANKYLEKREVKNMGKRVGMYGETDRVSVGKYAICRQDPEGENKSVWIEDTETGEGGEFSDEAFFAAINRFYVDNL